MLFFLLKLTFNKSYIFVSIYILITDVEYCTVVLLLLITGRNSMEEIQQTCSTIEFPSHTLGLEVKLSNIQPNGLNPRILFTSVKVV